MSDRLISANSLMSKLFVNSKGEMIPEHDCDNFPITLTIREVKDLIRNEPTAYDVDKVYEQITECLLDRETFTLTDLIDIVKGGGINE